MLVDHIIKVSEPGISNIINRKPEIAAILLKCIIKYGNTYAPELIVIQAKEHKELYDVLPILFRKYQANKINSEIIFAQALSKAVTDNPDAIDKLLDLIDDTKNQYYDHLINTLEVAIKNKNENAVKKILYHKKVVIASKDKQVLRKLAKNQPAILHDIEKLKCSDAKESGCRCVIF